MNKIMLAGETIRTAVALGPGHGYVYAANTLKEQAGDPYTKIFKLKGGTVEVGDCNYDAVSACFISDPSIGIVDVAENGYFTVNSRAGVRSGDLISSAMLSSGRRRFGGIRSISSIGGRAHAVGYEGMAYRLDAFAAWARIDEGIDSKFNIEAIDGFVPTDLYAVGEDGITFRLAGNKWQRVGLPTNANLNAVKCAPNGIVYAAGSDGVLVFGRDDSWTLFDEGTIEGEVWDLEWFNGRLYVSTMNSVYALSEKTMTLVSIGGQSERSCYQLSTGDGVLWSIGEHELWQFDGTNWTNLC